MNKQEIEKAIEVLRGIYPSQKAIKTGEYDHVADALDDAITALEHQLTNGWIPVSERLPDRLDEVMACSKDGIITIGYVRKREGYYTCEHLPFVTEDIIAWQPLPPKYEEVSE